MRGRPSAGWPHTTDDGQAMLRAAAGYREEVRPPARERQRNPILWRAIVARLTERSNEKRRALRRADRYLLRDGTRCGPNPDPGRWNKADSSRRANRNALAEGYKACPKASLPRE